MTPDARRAALLQAALQVFAERGYSGTSIKDIARASGSASGLLYHYFDSKEGLANAVYRDAKARMAHSIGHDFPRTGPWRQRFATLWARTLRFAQDEPATFQFLELHHHAHYLDAESHQASQLAASGALDFFRHGQSEGAFKEGPPDILLGIFMGALIGLLKGQAEGWLTLSPEGLAFAERATWEALRA